MSHNPYSSYRTSSTLETKGILLEEPDFRIRIARAGGKNVKFKQVTEREMRPLRRAIQLGQVSEELSQQKMAKILAEAVILQWQSRDLEGPENLDEAEWLDGIIDPDTLELVEDTVENRTRALTAAPELANYIFEQAKDTTLFREDLEADVKN